MKSATLASAIAATFGALSLGLGPFVAQTAAHQTDGFSDILLHAHNGVRTQRGEKSLVWSEKLSAEAKSYADELAREGKFAHSSLEQRNGAGENLWRGTEGRYLAIDMIQAFLDEERHFKPGIFPDNSTTGNWAQVGHFTQIIWPSTEEIGCALANGKGDDYLVCRYWPAGNRVGIELR